MNASNRSSRRASFNAVLVTAALAVTAVSFGAGCSSGVSPLANQQAPEPTAETSHPIGANACADKACGADCSPAGTDEPFSCTSTGACIAAGQELGCTTPPNPCAGKACGVDCSPAGSDEPFSCNAAGACAPTPVANDCPKCPAFLGDCIKGQSPADADGDGCIDSCR